MSDAHPSAAPFFSIAVTTYDRVDMLRESLQSILAQTFSDFEILVGNDNTERTIRRVLADIDDPRIRWIDHPENLGPVGNTNRLLELSRGTYFTTLADDDLFASDFLATMRRLIAAHPDVKVFFTDYAEGETPPPSFGAVAKAERVVAGERWVAGYLAKAFKVIGSYGVFKKEFLVSLGGMHTLGCAPRFSPYNDNLVAIQAGTAETVVFLEEPLIFFRLHPQSMSFSSSDGEAYASAQVEFVEKCDGILNSPSDKALSQNCYRDITRWFAADYFSVIAKSDRLQAGGIARHYFFLLGKALRGSSRFASVLQLNRLLVMSVVWRAYLQLRPRIDGWRQSG